MPNALETVVLVDGEAAGALALVLDESSLARSLPERPRRQPGPLSVDASRTLTVAIAHAAG